MLKNQEQSIGKARLNSGAGGGVELHVVAQLVSDQDLVWAAADGHTSVLEAIQSEGDAMWSFLRGFAFGC